MKPRELAERHNLNTETVLRWCRRFRAYAKERKDAKKPVIWSAKWDQGLRHRIVNGRFVDIDEKDAAKFVKEWAA